MRISKKKLAQLKAAARRGRKGASKAGKQIKPAAFAAIAGAGAELAGMVAASKIPHVGTSPIGGIALVAAGMAIATKHPAIGYGLAGAGGFWAATGTRVYMSIRKHAKEQQAQGYTGFDAGALVHPEAGALVGGPDLEWAPGAPTASYPAMETPQAAMLLPPAETQSEETQSEEAAAYAEAYALDGG